MRIADKPWIFFRIDRNKRMAFADVIIRNVAVDMFNKQCLRAETELIEDIPDCSALEETALGSVSAKELAEAVSRLPQRQRDILELKVYHGLEISEIAEKLSVSENVVRQRLFHARKNLRDFIERELI